MYVLLNITFTVPKFPVVELNSTPVGREGRIICIQLSQFILTGVLVRRYYLIRKNNRENIQLMNDIWNDGMCC